MSLVITPPKTLLVIVISGLVLAAHWLTFFHAIQISTVAIGLVGFSTFPVFVTLLEPLLFKHKLRGIDIVSAGMVLIGLMVIAPGFDLSNTVTLGLLWAVFSGFLFAILALINRHLVQTHSSVVIAFYQHSSAALCLLPFTVVFAHAPEPRTIWLLLVLGVLCTALPQTLFLRSLMVLKAQLVSVVTGLEPVYGILFAALLLSEIPNKLTVFGAIIVFGAVILAIKAHSIPDNRAASKIDIDDSQQS